MLPIHAPSRRKLLLVQTALIGERTSTSHPPFAFSTVAAMDDDARLA